VRAGEEDGASGWPLIIERVADVPWGIVTFVGLLVLLWAGAIDSEDLKALGTAAGLLGVGHGIHMGSKHFRS
jgi:hypothetical protein